jgi:hypothetical protein
MKKLTLMMIALLILTIVSCKKDEDDKKNDDKNNANTIVKVLDVSADLYNWRYFSFGLKDEVLIDDFTNNMTWDLGIRYENFRTNGGASGKGQGGVYDLGVVDFNSVTISSIAGKNIVADDSIQVVTSMGMPPTWATVPGSVPLEDMFASPTGPPPYTFTPNKHIYVIKTAEGKHVKFEGITFFNNAGESGHLRFRYEFLD